MQNIQWKNEFSIGIDAIDRQHREIFEWLLKLESAIEKRDPWHILHYFILELHKALRFHFEVEDALLEIVGFPDLAAHREGHHRLDAIIAELEVSLKQSSQGGKLLDFFESWFVKHVLGDDMRYAEFVRARLAATDIPRVP